MSSSEENITLNVEEIEAKKEAEALAATEAAKKEALTAAAKKEAAEAVKGNTSSGATKEVQVQTGVTVQAPQFINFGYIVAINTESGQYTERVEKA